jgi:biotin synthase
MGVDKVGIALDASTPELFKEIKGENARGPYSWDSHFASLKEALGVFTEGQVTTHLIVGLGENSKELLTLIDMLNKLKINISLFAFTPIKGTKLQLLQPPELIRFRKIQLARYLLTEKSKKINDFTFNSKGEVIRFNLNKQELWNIVDQTPAFLTSGCPGCNRPYYTSRPGGPIYNYPRKLNDTEKKNLYDLLIKFVN